MDASITRAIEVVHRESGYLRLRLPAVLRSDFVGAALEARLGALPGVRQIGWVTAEGTLSARFDPQVCTHADIARCMKAMAAGLPALEAAPAESASGSVLSNCTAQLHGLREKLVAAAPERFRPLVASATTEKAITNFTNDIVAFYLIKTHWDLITRLWIKNPVKYGNAWLTVFYLVFLLVRYRKS